MEEIAGLLTSRTLPLGYVYVDQQILANFSDIMQSDTNLMAISFIWLKIQCLDVR